MSPLVRTLLILVVILHGVIHLMGTTVYTRIGTLDSFPYKTTVLAGRLDLGTSGIQLFGILWLVAGLGTVLAGIGLLAGVEWAQPALLAATALSLVICLLDWDIAGAGLLVDAIILGLIAFGPRLTQLLNLP